MNKLVHQDTTLGYTIPITKEGIQKLKGGELYPLGLQHQMTIDDKGHITPKKRVTHDLSNRRKLGLSINQRVDEEKLPSTMYGYSLLRFLHLIHHIRFHHPNKRILLCKSDFDKAYRRLHTTPRIASKCMAAWHTIEKDQNDNKQQKKFIGTLLTRLPFGSSPAPAEFSTVSETIFDLASDLLQCPYWDTSTLPSPYSKDLLDPEYLPKTIPFGPALKADVRLPRHLKGGVDGYIDDGALAVLDSKGTSNMVKRAKHALPMATHLVFRPLKIKLEPVPRPDPQSIRKLLAEGRLRETLTYVGWTINTREFSVSLTEEKATTWIDSINDALTELTITFDDCETLVGRLNHVGFIIPTARFFLNRIRRLQDISDRYGRAMITQETRKDLLLWICFLTQSKSGISINCIIYRLPTTIGITDASEHGIGGYDLSTGISWRYLFSTKEKETFSLNLKEFIGSRVNERVLLPLDPSPNPCILNIGDSMSTTGWLNKANFNPKTHPMHNTVARDHAKDIMKHNASDYSQHIPGINNVVADCLSRDFHLSNKKLTSMLKSVNPPYLPTQLKIVPLSPTIISWIGSLAQNQPRRKEFPHKPTPSTLAAGIAGWNSTNNSTSITPCWTTSNHPKKYSSSALSCTHTDVERLIHDKNEFQGPLQERPSVTWQRPLLQVVGLTHRKTQQEKQT